VKAPDSLELRRLALAVAVLDDVDIVPHDDGLLLTGDVPVEVTWLELRRALAGADPESELGRHRVGAFLHGRRIAARTHPDHLRELARPVGLPVDHPMHPGLDWIRLRVLGGALDVGLGLVGAESDPDQVVVVPQSALDAAGIDPSPWWPDALAYLERMGAVAAERLRDGSTLRPIGDCDVVTLLASRTLREALAAQDGTGLRAAAVPMRRRGWLDLTRIDPAFTAAAAAATPAEDRGFPRPVLLTADEVSLAPEGGRPAEIVLRDDAAETPHLRAVLYR
jgi:hypothetical protein